MIIFNHPTCASEQNLRKENMEKENKSPNELTLRGKQLRHDIDERFDFLLKQNQLKSNGMGRNIITDIVSKFIPIDSSFSDAEKLLVDAGFKLSGRGLHVLYPTGEYASIDQYRKVSFGKISIGISILSKDGAPWGKVGKIESNITVQYL